MMEKLQKRGEELARDARRDVIGRLAAQIGEQLKTGELKIEDARVMLSESRLLQRWLTDPALRFVWSEFT
jgi:hypothetical protein